MKDLSKNDYPTWLYELFYKFSLIYADAWTRSFPREIDKQALMKIYFDALKNYREETIKDAVEKHLKMHKYPELHQLVSLCDESSKIGRYQEVQIEYLPLTERRNLEDSSPEAQKAILSIREFCKAHIRK